MIGVAALLLVAWVALFQVDSEEKQGFVNVEESAVADETASSTESELLAGSGTLRELQQLGRDIECVITYTADSGTATEGTYFVSDGSIRGDFLTDAPDLQGQILSSLIMDERMIYVWSEIEGEQYGMKMLVPENEAAAVEPAAETPVSMDEPVTYDCKPWPNVDKTIFVPPSDVLFQDYSELMQAGMQEGVLYEEGVVPEL